MPEDAAIEAILLAGTEANRGLSAGPMRQKMPMRGPILLLAFLSALVFGGLFVWLLM
jgi:hypothetical protein